MLEKTLESRSALSSGSRVLSFRSLSKLHLHCLLRCRAQFLEVNAKAQKPTQICFFYYTRRRRQLSGRRSVAVGAVVSFGKFVRKLLIQHSSLTGCRGSDTFHRDTHARTHVHTYTESGCELFRRLSLLGCTSAVRNTLVT